MLSISFVVLLLEEWWPLCCGFGPHKRGALKLCVYMYMHLSKLWTIDVTVPVFHVPIKAISSLGSNFSVIEIIHINQNPEIHGRFHQFKVMYGKNMSYMYLKMLYPIVLLQYKVLLQLNWLYYLTFVWYAHVCCVKEFFTAVRKQWRNMRFMARPRLQVGPSFA